MHVLRFFNCVSLYKCFFDSRSYLILIIFPEFLKFSDFVVTKCVIFFVRQKTRPRWMRQISAYDQKAGPGFNSRMETRERRFARKEATADGREGVGNPETHYRRGMFHIGNGPQIRSSGLDDRHLSTSASSVRATGRRHERIREKSRRLNAQIGRHHQGQQRTYEERSGRHGGSCHLRKHQNAAVPRRHFCGQRYARYAKVSFFHNLYIF